MTGLLLDVLYLAGLVATSPVWVYRMLRYGRYRTDLGQRVGAVPVRYGLQPVLWIHGVSLGEVNACRTLVDELHGQLPDYRVAISTTTDTGMAAARRLFGKDHVVFRWPLDFSLAVRRALGRLRPALVVLMEGEVWPNFLAACNRRGIPVVVVNARMSADKGYPRYRRLGSLAGRLFNRLTAIGVQDEAYAERFRSLGVAAEKLHRTGMMKFDTARVAHGIDGQDALAAAMGIGPADRLLVAGGTGPGEEAILLDVYARLRPRHPAARLVIVPRKPERFDEVARLIADRGFGVVRRTERPDGARRATDRGAVLLGDTMGELRKFYALAAAVFVGRSLVPMGGSDMIEAAALGKPTAFGPHTFNFPQAEALAGHGCVRLADGEALAAQFDAWLSDPAAAAAAGERARQYVVSQQGATQRNVEMICRVLHRVPAAAPGQIATDEIG
ncbi:MAG TPA: 3-deoxy-D-manno-octulosonic acid transferase [Phycisphaerae bacterium]|nr:3-deoxy-D-manno-octulosonic acid transferase [Phycisphaerae bacterium]